ncbi:TPA: hypothetical protein SOL98_000103 [Clostridioides difficile]|uniref:Uncharacterized protein n=3 Tax=Clostridioides difficile TaxID=1496 RepID=A0AB74Q6I3_CLODI|nr:hypothetical protein [Clostridioides difficile]AYD22100.1 hypothetical protein DA434_12905 [Clostridioides difficile]EGT3942882.1 hypothetical protein [Clostridioides difficile]EGT4017490.1 hypothetical protein [Clostridioides difficile]EGT4099192.1 hypothetical protein [Clostridioides difficile]EGT4245179.1 hypothetical protein [Clostridioides difficile]
MREIKAKFYRSGDIVRDIGIVYFYELLMDLKNELEKNDYKLKFTCELNRNYLSLESAEYIDPKYISDYILENQLFKVFKNGKKEALEKIFNNIDNLTYVNFIEELDKSSATAKQKEDIKKDFKNRRFPYVRNSGKYGLNTSLENMETNVKNIVDTVIKSNIEIDKIDLEQYEEKDSVCNVCNINKTTKLDIDLRERKDSKYNFLFRGAEKSGFKRSGQVESNICFECEFFNLMCLLYINLKRPMVFAYTNDLRELAFLNHKIMLKRKMYSDKSFYKKLLHEKISSIRLYRFDIDTNKGIILKFDSIIEYKELLKKIELIDIIDNYNFSREPGNTRNLGKRMIDNGNLSNLKELLLDNISVLKQSTGTSREMDFVSSSYNIGLYIKLCWIVDGGEEYKMKNYMESNLIYSRVGKDLFNKMTDESRRKNFSMKVIQLLKSNDRTQLFQTIMHVLVSNGILIGEGFVEGLMQSSELELNTNVGLFIQEIMK